MENDMSSSNLDWLIVDHQGEADDKANGSTHSSRRNSSSSGASGGFVKIDDNEVEACGEEQHSMHEYAADVVNQLVLPIHSSSDSINASSPRDEASSSDKSSFGEVGMQRRLSAASSLSHEEEEVEMAVLLYNHETVPTIDMATGAASTVPAVDVEEVVMWQPATPLVPIASAIENQIGAADQSASNLHDTPHNATEGLEDSNQSAGDIKEKPLDKNEGYADEDQSVSDSEVIFRDKEHLLDDIISAGLELSYDASSYGLQDNNSGSSSHSWEITESTSCEKEKEGVTSDEHLTSNDMTVATISLPHNPQTLTAKLWSFLVVSAELCGKFFHSRLRCISTVNLHSAAIAVLLFLILGFFAGYHTGCMYDINTRQALADNLAICTNGLDQLEVVRNRLVKCKDRHWALNGVILEYERKFEAEEKAMKAEHRAITAELTREKEELQQLIVNANRQLNEMRIENDDLRRAVSKLRYARPAYEDSAKEELERSMEGSDSGGMSEDEADALNWGHQQQQDSSQTSKETKDSEPKQSADLDNSCWFHLWMQVQNFTLSSKQGTPFLRSELDSFFKDFTTCVLVLESDITKNGDKSSAFNYLPFIASSLWAQLVMMEQSRTPPTQPYSHQNEGASVVDKVNDLLQRCWKAISNPKHVHRAFEATKNSLGRLRKLFNETVHGEAVRSTMNVAKDTAASLAKKMDNILGQMHSFVGGIFDSKTKEKDSGLNEKKSGSKKVNADEQMRGNEKSKKKASEDNGERKSFDNKAKTKKEKRAAKMAKRAEYENKKKQEKAVKENSFAHNTAHKFEQSQPDHWDSTTHPCRAKCPSPCGCNTRRIEESNRALKGWRQYFTDKWNTGKQRWSTWWGKRGQGQDKGEDLGHSCTCSIADEEVAEVVDDSSSQQEDVRGGEDELQQQWEEEQGDGFNNGDDEEQVDWFSKRAADREFQRDKPWYYRRAEDRANNRHFSM